MIPGLFYESQQNKPYSSTYTRTNKDSIYLNLMAPLHYFIYLNVRKIRSISYILMKAASEKTSPVLTAMHHAGKMRGGIRVEQGTNQRVIGALCGTVPFAFTAFDCSIDSDVFHTWADRNTAAGTTRVQCDPDGHAPFRKRQDTLDALQAEGHTGCCGSQPYSPDFNLIEKTWHGPSS